MVSIIIPTYEQNGHGAKMLSELLNSIFRQECKYKFEVVISDNSTQNMEVLDVAYEYVNKLYTKGISAIYIPRVKPIGVAANFNNAIQAAEYDLIKPMCQDDRFFHKKALEMFCEAIADKGWAISHSYYMNENGSVTHKKKAFYDPYMFIVPNTVGMPSCIMFRKSELRFRTDLQTITDQYFYFQLYVKYGQPALIPEYLIGQRLWEGSVSSIHGDHSKEDLELLQDKGLIKQN